MEKCFVLDDFISDGTDKRDGSGYVVVVTLGCGTGDSDNICSRGSGSFQI